MGKTEQQFVNRKQQFLVIANELSEFFDKKNRDYGDSYFEKGIDGYPVDKVLDKCALYIELRRKFVRLGTFALKKT